MALGPTQDKTIVSEKANIRSRHLYDANDIVRLYMEKKIPILVKHGVAAVWEGTYRQVKKTSRGVIRTKNRIPVSSRSVTRTKQGFIDAFNIIMAQFKKYGYLAKTVNLLTGPGRKRNTMHMRETDSRRRTSIFDVIFARYFLGEVQMYKIKNGQVKLEGEK